MRINKHTREKNPGEFQLSSKRVSHPLDRYVLALNYIMLTDCGEPFCYKEVLQVVNSEKWHLAMQSEIAALHKNQTWDLVKLPDGKKALPCKWIFTGISLLLMWLA